MKKLRIISIMIPLVDALLLVLVLNVELIPVLNNILVIYTCTISPIIEAIIIGMMSDKVKNKIYKILLIMLTILIVIMWFLFMIVGLILIKETHAAFQYENTTYYAFDNSWLDPNYNIYVKATPFTMKELSYEKSKKLLLNIGKFKNVSSYKDINVLIEYFNKF